MLKMYIMDGYLKSLNVSDWQKKPKTFNRVRVKIDDDLLLFKQMYGQEVYARKCEDVFQYIQEHHKNDGTTSVA